MKIHAIRINSACLHKSLANLKEFLSKEDPAVLVVMSSEKANSLFVNLIHKHLVIKEEASAETQELIGYYSGLGKGVLGDSPQSRAYVAQVEETIGALVQTLIEGSLFKMDTRSLEDYALANGAALSARLVQYYLHAARFIDGRDLVVSDDNFGDAVINWTETRTRVQTALEDVKGCTVVSAGFGKTKQGYTTSLGKGGFDLFTTTIGSIVPCDEVIIYTYVNGIYNADPALVDQAVNLESITYEEAAQLSFTANGAIYPPAIWPAVKANIPIVVKSVLEPGLKGTYISAGEDKLDHRLIKGITNLSGLDLITVYGNGLLGQIGTSSKLFGLLSENGINIMFISQSSSEYSISFAVDGKDGKKAVEAISKARKNKQFLSLDETVFVKKNVGIVSVCGNKMRNVPGVSGKLFSVLGAAGVNIIAAAQGGEELNISVVVAEKDIARSVNAIFEAFLK